MHATHAPSTAPTITDDTTLPSDVELVRAGDQPATPVDWLWPDRIPIGKVTLLVGDPGLGKSLIALDVASRVSRAAAWPDEAAEMASDEARMTNESELVIRHSEIRHSTAALRLPPSSTLILSAEDDLADTIRPRLDACHANCDRIFVLPSVADLRHDFAQLRDTIDRLPNCRLIVIDPLNAYVGPNDSHFQVVVRRILAPLTRLAREKRAAVLAVAHLRKSHGAPIYRTAGSMGFVSAARAVWIVCRDPSDAGRNLLLPLKTNLSAAACGLAYRIEPQPPHGVPAIAWDPTPITARAEEVLAISPKPRPPAPERAEARVWLRDVLAGGPRPASDVIDEGESRGFLRRTIQRAFFELGGHTAKRGLLHGWWWSLGQPIESGDSQGLADIFEDVTTESPIEMMPTLAESMAALDRMRRRRDNHEE